MYHPPDTLPEYIEVYNNTATPFDIAEWRLCDGVDYVFPAFSLAAMDRTFLKPFERIVLSGVDEATLRAAYNLPPTVRVYGPWTGNLKNGGERITLRDKNGVTVCTVEYNDRGRWSPAADGAGHTLVLKNPDRKIDDWRNWRRQRPPGRHAGQRRSPGGGNPRRQPGNQSRRGNSLCDLRRHVAVQRQERGSGDRVANGGLRRQRLAAGARPVRV